MRILNFVPSFWHSAQEAQEKGEGEFGLKAWLARTERLFSPVHTFITCGTWSDPEFSPINVPVINSGVEFTKPYDHFYWMYDGCAYTAAFAYALNRRDWDLLVVVDMDVLIGAVDFDSLLREFLERPEHLLSPDWHGRPGGPFHCWKRQGAVLWLHGRKRANLIEPKEGDPLPLLIEDEMGEIFKGSWFCPWPHLPTMRQDFGCSSEIPEREPLEKAWPFVRMPNPAIVEEYARTQTSLAKPVKR